MLALTLGQDPPRYSGIRNQTHLSLPKVDAAPILDGRLDEPVWGQAAVLTEFSQFQPVDGRPAEERTEVLVWYSSEAIYFGIRAFEDHGAVVRATRANRDNIGSDDHIQVLLDTNNDQRIAYLFGVNPFGVQQDGTRSAQFGGGAGGSSATGGGFGNLNPLDGNVDLNPDYFFESHGELFDGGYMVEIRIPFKSLRYQDAPVQSWGIHILRRVQHSGYQDSWAPAVRANSNFLSQAGILVGMQGLRRGLVLEVTPTTTGRLDGAPAPPGGWEYHGTGEVGADIRWGIRQNLTLNGTLNPDFSQVEADVGQVSINERFALFFPDKRPFFLDGLELFDTPNQLIHTRRIIDPKGGMKLIGKLGGVNLATLVAVDNDGSTSGLGSGSPVFGLARLRRDLGGSSTLGAVVTTREKSGDFSRLAGADLRLYYNRLYYVEVQGVESWAETDGVSRRGRLVEVEWDRTGRAWGFNHSVRAISSEFEAAAGFVNRTGLVSANSFNRLTLYGAEDALIQTAGAFFGITRLWDYDDLDGGPLEGSESISPSATLRGGWQVGGSVSRSFFSFNDAGLAGLMIERTVGGVVDTVAFVVPGKESDLWGGSLRVTTPTYKLFTANASYSTGRVPIFREGAKGKSTRWDMTMDLRPTAGLRGTLQLTRLTLDRTSNGSRFSSETIPRIKVEYQINRAIFLRLVTQYSALSRAALQDRDGNPIISSGVKDQGSTNNELRVDWLFSYRPIPGTLFFLGYGATLEEPMEFQFSDLRRRVDGFFVKASYLLRL